jgi:hypothetical protein
VRTSKASSFPFSIIDSIYLLLDLDGVGLVDWHLNLIGNLLLDGVWYLDFLVDWVRSGGEWKCLVSSELIKVLKVEWTFTYFGTSTG